MANNGLQPVNFFLAIFPSVVCVALVSIRIWMRSKQRLLGVGKESKCPALHHKTDSVLRRLSTSTCDGNTIMRSTERPTDECMRIAGSESDLIVHNIWM